MKDASVDNLFNEAATCAMRYLSNIHLRKAEVEPSALEALSTLRAALPAKGECAVETIRLLDRVGSPATVASMGGRFFGGVVGAAFPVAVAAHWLADAWNQNVCLYDYSPVGCAIEDIAASWILHVLSLPSHSAVSFVTGTQMADVVALASARQALLTQAGWQIAEEGLFGAPPITVVVGEEVHATMIKALKLLGFGRSNLVFVPSDTQGRLIASRIPKIDGPLIICAQAGNVNSGACDPFNEICDVAAETGAWVHVDGAFGLWAAVDTQRAALVDGVSRADSWALDAHKWLNASYDCGLAIVKDEEHLRRSMSVSGAYYSGDFVRDRQPMQIGPESSRRARGVEVWATMRTLGKDGIVELISRTCELARLFAHKLAAAGFQILNDVVLNQVLVTADNDAQTDEILSILREDGTCWLRGSVWKGHRVIRISVSSYLTTPEDVDACVDAMIRARSRLAKPAEPRPA